MAKIALKLFALILCYSTASSLVTDYEIVTWNSDGFKLTQVFDLFTTKPSLCAVFVQESGNVATNVRAHLVTSNLPEFILVDGESEFACDSEGFYELRTIRVGNELFYIYYIPAANNVHPKVGQTIVSRRLADAILFFPSLNNHRNVCNNRSFINRPVVGLLFRDGQGNENIFFNIHAENVNHQRPVNEVPNQLSAIRTYMGMHRPTASWLLVGDYNRIPASVQPSLTAQERIISPNRNTRAGRVLDYLVFGSSDPNVFARMQRASYQGNVIDDLRNSDHKAVHFTNNQGVIC